MTDPPRYTPALRYRWLTPVFDWLVSVFLREERWRPAMIEGISPGDVVVDVGCGTGSLLILLKSRVPEATAIGIDPDPDVLAIARAKAARAGADITFVEAMGDDWPPVDSVTHVLSSLVLHQVPMAGKRAIIAAAHRHLSAGGRLTIVDYGKQGGLARLGFLMTQMLDGFKTTRPNAQGCVPRLLARAGFDEVCEHWRLATVSGSLSMYTARRAE